MGTGLGNLKMGIRLKIQKDEKKELEEDMNNIYQDSSVFAFPLLTNSYEIKRQSTTSHVNIIES